LIVEFTTSCLVPFGITGRIWRKSPPSTTTLPPIGIALIYNIY
jgi:hypothetical protein